MFIIPCFPFGSVARPDPPGVHLTWPELFSAYFTFGTLNEAFEVILLKHCRSRRVFKEGYLMAVVAVPLNHL